MANPAMYSWHVSTGLVDTKVTGTLSLFESTVPDSARMLCQTVFFACLSQISLLLLYRTATPTFST